MARGEKSISISSDKKSAREKQKKLQASGLSKRNAEGRAWEQTTQARSKRQAGTAGGRSRVSKRTTWKSTGSTSKTKISGKTRR